MFFRTAFILIVSLSFNASAFEGRDLLMSYPLIDSMFNRGTTFDFASKLGWYSGRCFRAEPSSSAIAAVVALESRQTGPSFPADQKFFMLVNTQVSENYYDQIRAVDLIAIERLINNLWPTMFKVADQFGFSETNQDGTQTLRLSEDGLYLVGKAINAQTGSSLTCFYFKWVKANQPLPN